MFSVVGKGSMNSLLPGKQWGSKKWAKDAVLQNAS